MKRKSTTRFVHLTSRHPYLWTGGCAPARQNHRPVDDQALSGFCCAQFLLHSSQSCGGVLSYSYLGFTVFAICSAPTL